MTTIKCKKYSRVEFIQGQMFHEFKSTSKASKSHLQFLQQFIVTTERFQRMIRHYNNYINNYIKTNSLKLAKTLLQCMYEFKVLREAIIQPKKKTNQDCSRLTPNKNGRRMKEIP